MKEFGYAIYFELDADKIKGGERQRFKRALKDFVENYGVNVIEKLGNGEYPSVAFPVNIRISKTRV